MTKLGRILGVVGGAAVVTVPFPTMFLWDWEFNTLVAVQLILGLVFVGIWLATNLAGLRQRFLGRSAFYWSFTVLYGVAAVALAFLLNYLAWAHPAQADLTSEGVFSLSDQSQSVLASLEDEVKAIAFYSTKEPAYEVVKNFLERYRYGSNRFSYEFVDPVVREDLVEKYRVSADGPRIVLSYKGKEERIKIDDEGSSGPEETITAALLKLTASGSSHKICFLTGHGERSLQGQDAQSSMTLWVEDMRTEGFQPEPLSLLESPEVPADCKALVVVGPRQPIIDSEIQSIQKYLDGGGRVMIFAGYQDAPSLNALALSYGIQVGADVVVNPRSRSPLEAVTDPMRYPQDHAIFSRFFRGGVVVLNQLQAVFPMAHSVKRAGGNLPGVETVELAATGPQSWGETDNLEKVDSITFDSGKDVPGPVPMAAVAQKQPAPEGAAAVGARLAVFGSSLVPVDAAYRIFPFNRNLVMNTLAWLTAEEKKITIRPRFRAASLLRLDEGQMKFISSFSTVLLPLLILAVGMTVRELRRSA